MTFATERLFHCYETLPFICLGDQKVAIPYETGGSDAFGYRSRGNSTTLPDLFTPENQQRLVEEGVDIEEELGVEVEDYYNQLVEDLPGLYDEYVEDKEEFMENYSYFQGSENWEAVFALYQQLTEAGEELSLFLDKELDRECLYIHLLIGQPTDQ